MGCRHLDKPDPAWAPLRGLQGPSGHLHLMWHRVPHGLQVGVCSTMVLHGMWGNSLPHHDLLQGTLLWHLEYLLPSSFHCCLPGCLNLFPPLSVSPTAVQPFLSTLKYLSQSHLHMRGSPLPWGGSIGAGCTQDWAAPASSQRLP